MSWQEVSTLVLKSEFVWLAQQEACNFSELCMRFNISRKTGYKWLERFRELGEAGLVAQSRRPYNPPQERRQPLKTLWSLYAVSTRHGEDVSFVSD